MNFKSLSNKIRSTVETEATALEQDFIIEELSDEAQAAIVGGKGKTVITADSTSSFTAEDYYKLAGFWGG